MHCASLGTGAAARSTVVVGTRAAARLPPLGVNMGDSSSCRKSKLPCCFGESTSVVCPLQYPLQQLTSTAAAEAMAALAVPWAWALENLAFEATCVTCFPARPASNAAIRAEDTSRPTPLAHTSQSSRVIMLIRAQGVHMLSPFRNMCVRFDDGNVGTARDPRGKHISA